MLSTVRDISFYLIRYGKRSNGTEKLSRSFTWYRRRHQIRNTEREQQLNIYNLTEVKVKYNVSFCKVNIFSLLLMLLYTEANTMHRASWAKKDI
jgi:hypothetical protein